MSTDLCALTASELAPLIARRAVSPVEVVEAALARAQAWEPKLNAFVDLRAEAARAAARTAEAAVMAGDPLGPLHGVPITIKDNVAMRGLPTGNGCIATAARQAAADATPIARLNAAGAIILGKTTLPEFAHRVLTDSPGWGVTRNPWNLAHTPGGSSGGASAALAAGVAPLAIGTDGGGSIRCPAACTGTFGLKATLGRIPQESAPDGFGNFSFLGPLTRSTADLALLLAVLEGPVAVDPWSLALGPTPPPERAVRGLRIGWMQHCGPYRTEPETAALTAAAVAALAAAGAIVEPLTDPCFDAVFATYQVLATANHAARLGPLADAAAERMTPSLVESIGIGRGWSGVQLLQAQDRRTTLFRAVQTLFERFDLIATPTMLGPPPRLDAGGSIATEFYAEWAAPLYPFNLTGHPAASVPAGFTAAGLPVGLQFVGPWHAEPRILAAAATLEATHAPSAGRVAPMP